MPACSSRRLDAARKFFLSSVPFLHFRHLVQRSFDFSVYSRPSMRRKAFRFFARAQVWWFEPALDFLLVNWDSLANVAPFIRKSVLFRVFGFRRFHLKINHVFFMLLERSCTASFLIRSKNVRIKPLWSKWKLLNQVFPEKSDKSNKW